MSEVTTMIRHYQKQVLRAVTEYHGYLDRLGFDYDEEAIDTFCNHINSTTIEILGE